MRNPGRLDRFYEEMLKIHKEKYPDLRFGQFVDCFFYWIGKDNFYIEDEEMIQLLRSFAAGEDSPYKKRKVEDS